MYNPVVVWLYNFFYICPFEDKCSANLWLRARKINLFLGYRFIFPWISVLVENYAIGWIFLRIESIFQVNSTCFFNFLGIVG